MPGRFVERRVETAMSRWGSGCAPVAIFALLGLAPGSVMADEPYELNVITSLTGPLAFVGETEVESLQLVEASVNRTGGIKGRSIHFVVYDDATNPQNAVQLLNQLI